MHFLVLQPFLTGSFEFETPDARLKSSDDILILDSSKLIFSWF